MFLKKIKMIKKQAITTTERCSLGFADFRYFCFGSLLGALPLI